VTTLQAKPGEIQKHPNQIMKTKFVRRFAALTFLAITTLNPQLSTALAQGTAFTYQGQLLTTNGPAHGLYNLQFSLYGGSSGGSALYGPVTTNGVFVTNGLFTVTVDFGSGIFVGTPYWLQIGVETNGAASFTTLSLRQQLTPTPYAIYAEGANAAGLSGTIPMASLSGTFSGAVTLNNPANSFAGNGASISNVNAATLAGLAAANFWQTTGNAGTTAGLNFVGTKDNQPLELHVNGTRAFRIEPGANGNSNIVNVIGGSANTVVETAGATIGGGYLNTNYSFYATIGGGTLNEAVGPGSFIGGGGFDGSIYSGNFIPGPAGAATVGGGIGNGAYSKWATLGGGAFNSNDGVAGTIAVGLSNSIISTADYSTVGGGEFNTVWGVAGTIDGGLSNSVYHANYATVGGGALNTASGPGSFIGGGGYDGFGMSGNTASGAGSAIGGGLGNQATGDETAIAGGTNNAAGGQYAAVGGGAGNFGFGYAATIAGGYSCYAGDYAVVGGGYQNSAGTGGVVGGGGANLAADLATVAGGESNNATGTGSFVGGGGYNGSSVSGNTASGTASTVAGGYGNQATSAYASVGGGDGNFASGNYATVPGGYGNTAHGQVSFAAGEGVSANDNNSFIWGDGTRAGVSQGADTFTVLATGGAFFYTTTSGVNVEVDPTGDLDFGTTTRQMLNLYSSTYGIGVQSSDEYFRTAGQFYWFQGGTNNNANGNAGGGSTLMSLSTSGLTVNGTFVSASARNLKEHFQAVDARQMLEKVAALPVSRWNYKQDTTSEHIGPMAQDFYAAFGVGPDDKHITTIDEGGVALAAIKGLNQKLNEKDAEIQELKARLEKLEELVDPKNGGVK